MSSSLPSRSRTEMAPTTSTEEKPNTPVDGDLSLKQLLARPNCLRNKGGDDTADERTAARPGEVINGSSQDDVLPDAAAPLKNATIRELLDLPRLDERLAAESKKVGRFLRRFNSQLKLRVEF